MDSAAKRGAAKRFSAFVFGAGFASLGLSACTVATPAAITSAQNPPASTPITSVEFVSQDDEHAMRTRFMNALSTSFAGQGVSVAAGADYIADFTIAQRPAQLGLLEANGAEESAAKAPTSDFSPRWFHSCKPDKVSASLVIYAKANGMLHSKSEGEFLACRESASGESSELQALAELLTARALKN